jgi:hypothetical protein
LLLLGKNCSAIFGFNFIPLFLFERKRGKKNQKPCRFIALSEQIRTRKSAPLPAVISDEIPRNREAWNYLQIRYDLQTIKIRRGSE